MRNLVYRVGPKTSNLPSPGQGPKFLGSTCHASKHSYLLGFCHIGTPDATQEVDLVPPCQLHLDLVSQLGPIWHHIIKQYLEPDDARKATTSLRCQQNTPSKS